MTNTKKWIILVLLPIIIGVSASASGFSLVWKLCVLSILAPVISFGWSWLNVRGIKAQIRSLPTKTFIGDVLENKLKLINVTRIPKLMLKVEENTDLPGYSNVSLFNLSRGGSYSLSSLACCLRRGQYTLGSYTLTASDPLGLFPRQIALGNPQSILIYPNSVDLPFFDPLSSLSLVYGAGQWIQSQISPNVSSIREYSSGDSLKHIHWGSTAHSGQLMVKLFDPDRSHSSAKTIWVVLDMQKDVHYGEGLQSTEEYGVSIAASLVKKYIESGWPVGFMAEADQRYLFQPESSAQHAERISGALAAIRSTGEMSLEQLLASESNRFDLDTLIIAISPSWSDRLVSPLLQMRSQQKVVTAILLDPETFGAERSQKHTAHTLALNGVQVYVVRKGDNLAAALDTRNLSTNKL